MRNNSCKNLVCTVMVEEGFRKKMNWMRSLKDSCEQGVQESMLSRTLGHAVMKRVCLTVGSTVSAANKIARLEPRKEPWTIGLQSSNKRTEFTWQLG